MSHFHVKKFHLNSLTKGLLMDLRHIFNYQNQSNRGPLFKSIYTLKVKVKCTLVQALRLCTGCTAHRGSRGIALPFHDHGTRSGLGVTVMPRPPSTPGKDPVPTVQEAGWAPGPEWTGAENLSPTRIPSPDCPARSQSLYRLSYQANKFMF